MFERHVRLVRLEMDGGLLDEAHHAPGKLLKLLGSHETTLLE